MTRTTYPMSENQARLLRNLVAERILTPATAAHLDSLRARYMAGEATFAEAKAVITILMTAKRKQGDDGGQAEPGFYVQADGTAIQVVMNRAGTNTYAKRWTGTRWDYAPGVGKTLAGLEPMTGEVAARMGLASGRCIACAKVLGGETLSAKVSALVGYGETCAAKHGWTYPKGVAAQREFLGEEGS